MQLDPNIILQARGVQLDNPMDVYGKALNLKQLSNQNAAQEQAMQKQQILSQAVKTSMTPDGKIDHQQVIGKLSQVDPLGAQEYEGQVRAKALQKLKNDHDIMSMVLPGANLENWAEAKKQLIKQGVNGAEQLSDSPDEKYISNLKNGLLSFKDQFDRHKDDRDFQQKERFHNDEMSSKKTGDAGKLASDLRKERSSLPTTKATQDISVAFNKIQRMSKAASPAGDMAMIFSYMKVLDPGSTVREGEYATAQNATSVPTQVLNAYNRALKGEKLAPEQRLDFLNQAKSLYESQIDVQRQVDSQFSDLASKNGIDPKEVILNFEANTEAKPKWAK